MQQCQYNRVKLAQLSHFALYLHKSLYLAINSRSYTISSYPSCYLVLTSQTLQFLFNCCTWLPLSVNIILHTTIYTQLWWHLACTSHKLVHHSQVYFNHQILSYIISYHVSHTLDLTTHFLQFISLLQPTLCNSSPLIMHSLTSMVGCFMY